MKKIMPLLILISFVALSEQIPFDNPDDRKRSYLQIQRLNAITELKWKIKKKEIEALKERRKKRKRMDEDNLEETRY